MLTRDFLLAGRAVFTVANDKGNHYTYKIKFKPANGNYGDTFFVSLLTGPDNTSDYTYVGVLDTNLGNLKVRPTKNSKFSGESLPIKVVNWAVGVICAGKVNELPAGYSIHHEGKCGRCGRTLTTPQSCEIGIGPECLSKM